MSGSLAGMRIVNTRAVHQAGALDRLLEKRGAIPVPYPCIAIELPTTTADLDAALGRLAGGRFEWLVLTSANTVHAVACRLHTLGLRLSPHSGFKTAMVGPATAVVARQLLGLEPSVIPATHTGAELAEAIPVNPGDTVLLPGSEIARPDVADGLRARGTIVTAVTAYRTVVGQGGADLARLLGDRAVDALTFCSSSAVHGFVVRTQPDAAALESARALPAACIGPNTHATALGHGFAAVGAGTHTIEGLAAALEQIGSVQSRGGTRWH